MFLVGDLSVLEVVLGHSLHPPVLLDVVPHLQVTGVGDEECVSRRRRLVELFQLEVGGGQKENRVNGRRAEACGGSRPQRSPCSR